MCAHLAHRGPDDAGTWSDGGRIGLGNRRLAIIDLSPLGRQPMADERQQVWVTYNGEIYNFAALREELQAKGYRLRTRTDTEVLLYLYQEHGAAMVDRLRGMFAFALWDGGRQELLLARDRLGIKPLYYCQTPEGLVFGSEIKALCASGLVPRIPDATAIAAFLRMGSVPGPRTAIQGVHELAPGTLMRARGGVTAVTRYWDIPAPEEGAYNAERVAAELRTRLTDAVESHLVSDVPLGVFLSGGIDSSTVVALLRAAGHRQLKTFAISFQEGVSEARFASAVARRFQTDHTETVIGPMDLRRDLDQIIGAMDQPSVDGFNTYFVSKMTRATGTIVALSGLGGDELFAGYPSFSLVPRLRRVRQWMGHAGALAVPAGWILDWVPGSRLRKLREVIRGDGSLGGAYVGVRGLFAASELSALVRDEHVLGAVQHLPPDALLTRPLPDFGDPVADVGYLEMRAYMHNQLLRDTDVMSMVHSLEVRVPFLDHQLVEFVARLPRRIRHDRGRPKALLLQTVGDLLPSEIIARPKRGFTFPMEHWLRGPLRPLAEELLLQVHSGGLFQQQAVQRIWRAFLQRRMHWSRIWALIVADRWMAHAVQPRPARLEGVRGLGGVRS